MDGVVAFDIGTYSIRMACGKGNDIEIVMPHDDHSFPSSFAINDGDKLFGTYANSCHNNVIRDLKSYVNTDIEISDSEGVHISPSESANTIIAFNEQKEKQYTISDIFVFAFKEMLSKVETKISKLLLVFPEWYPYTTKELIKRSIEVTGIYTEIVNTINSMIYDFLYRNPITKNGCSLFADMGSSSFSIAVVKFDGNNQHILNSGFLPIGGKFIDKKLERYIVNKLKENNPELSSPLTKLEEQLPNIYIDAIIKMKESFTVGNVGVFLFENYLGQYNFRYEMKIEEFEELIRPLLAAIKECAKSVYNSSDQKIQFFENTGGMLLFPLIRNAISSVINEDCQLSSRMKTFDSIVEGAVYSQSKDSSKITKKARNLFVRKMEGREIMKFSDEIKLEKGKYSIIEKFQNLEIPDESKNEPEIVDAIQKSNSQIEIDRIEVTENGMTLRISDDGSISKKVGISMPLSVLEYSSYSSDIESEDSKIKKETSKDKLSSSDSDSNGNDGTDSDTEILKRKEEEELKRKEEELKRKEEEELKRKEEEELKRKEEELKRKEEELKRKEEEELKRKEEEELKRKEEEELKRKEEEELKRKEEEELKRKEEEERKRKEEEEARIQAEVERRFQGAMAKRIKEEEEKKRREEEEEKRKKEELEIKKKEKDERERLRKEEEEKKRKEMTAERNPSVSSQQGEGEAPIEERDEVTERRRYRAAKTLAEFELLWKEYAQPFRKRAAVLAANPTMTQNIHGLFIAQADPYSLMTMVSQDAVDRLVDNFYAEVRTLYLKGNLKEKPLWDVVYFAELSRMKLVKYTKLSNQEFKFAIEYLKGRR